MELTVDQALQQGVAAHKEGKLEEAERLYRAIVQSQPLHPDANHNLGVLAVSVNKADAALPLFKTALEANPKIEQFWVSYIDALVKANKLQDAKKEIKRIIGQWINGKMTGYCLGFEGPPGIGKTSLAKQPISRYDLNFFFKYNFLN